MVALHPNVGSVIGYKERCNEAMHVLAAEAEIPRVFIEIPVVDFDFARG